MKRIVWLHLVLLCLLFASWAHAEGGCPPGMAPYRSNDMSSCGPIPGYGQDQPRWSSQWGAIATYEPNGSLGTATNMPSESSATKAALSDCQSKHGSTCVVELTYHDQCAAMVVSDKGYNIGRAESIALASQQGMDICQKSGEPNCHVYYTACSMPKRVQ